MSLVERDTPELEPRPIDGDDVAIANTHVTLALVHDAVQAEKQRRGGDYLTAYEIITIDRQTTQPTDVNYAVE